MGESILATIKAALGIDVGYRPFDNEIVMHANAFLRALNQFGIGNETLTLTEYGNETWSDFLGDDVDAYMMAQSYLALKVRMVFDPPTSSIVMQSMKETAAELEWRLIEYADAKNIQAEGK